MEVLDIIVPNPATPLLPAIEASHWAMSVDAMSLPTVVWAIDVDGCVVSYEKNGYQAVADEVVKRLSLEGHTAVLHYSINADSTFAYAARGRIVRTFDPVIYDEPAQDWQGGRLPEEHLLDFETAPVGATLRLIERLTDVSLAGLDLTESSQMSYGRIG